MMEIMFPKDIVLDVSLLKKENSSSKARSLRKKWLDIEKTKDLFVFHSCDDAREGDGVSIFNNPGIISIRSISAANVFGGDEDFFKWIYQAPAVRAIGVAGHYDGSSYIEGEEPLGCGGHGEKRKIGRETVVNTSRKTASAEDYVRKLIVHEDPLKQAIVSAIRTASIVDKPVVAGLIDHSNLSFKPVMIIEENGRKIRTAVSLENLLSSDNKLLYQNGIPELPFDLSNPDWLYSLRQNNQEVVKRLPTNFALKQKTQDPHTVAISTDIRPMSIRLPYTFGENNTGFGITLPYSKDENGKVNITDKAIHQSLAQANYPLDHATKAQTGQPFYNTRNVLIETPDLNLSRSLAEKLLQKNWGQQWLERKKGQILVAQVNSAQTNFLEKFKTT
ncbi:MAG: hypothetical protein NUV87_01045 [Candidatus Roizmanbacteria bacterium]|nr:hypothetical protein [Candidatus Roizmanbacteria bacterium]MCR4312877.1 hypothetical protein [Candidatus Roizmanbacteria bacterium]